MFKAPKEELEIVFGALFKNKDLSKFLQYISLLSQI
jgi:hypothetical protein